MPLLPPAPPRPKPAPPILLQARGPDLVPVGPFQGLTKATLIPRFNAVGAWSLEMPYDMLDPVILAALRAGGGLIATRGTRTLLSGPFTQEQLVESSSQDVGVKRVMTLSGVSDEAWLGWRLAYADPAHAADAQEADHDDRSGDGETVMKGYVAANLGAGALLARRIPLTIPTNAHRGAPVTGSARFDNLLELLQSLASAAGLGFRLRQQGGALVFEVFEPRDLTATARFSRGLGNLRGYTLNRTGPTVTRPHIAASGDGIARVIAVYTDAETEAAWGRSIEVIVDRSDSEDPDVLAQTAQEAITAGSPMAGLTLQPIDVPQLQYGVHYNEGDRVTVDAAGLPFEEIVREAELVLGESGRWVTTPTVGGESASATPALYKRVLAVERFVRQLKARR